uniref:Uncharacterized protein n=1 Tax=Picea glauca TaxID=3330 RepID=A0A101LX27_PICGL|nr:hypothetical protein ABT39_MTgene5958 [Picea glauca]
MMYGRLHYQISTGMKGKEGLFSRTNPNPSQALPLRYDQALLLTHMLKEI